MLSDTQTPASDSADGKTASSRTKARYFLTWRWHFYAGLYVVPFTIMLSLTGLIMLFDEEIEHFQHQEILTVVKGEQIQSADRMMHSVKVAYPEHQITQYIPSFQPDVAHRFSLSSPEGNSFFVTVNPYDASVLGEMPRSTGIYQLANDIHGTLLIGDWGDYLIEIAASLSILLLLSGVYLWLPLDKARAAGFLKFRKSSGPRIFYRDLHANIGGVTSIALLFFLLSGLAWAGIWGGKFVQPWSSFPTFYTWGSKPESEILHKHLNHGSEEEMPWGVELTEVPESDHHGHHHQTSSEVWESELSLQALVDQAKKIGFYQFRIFFPRDEKGVFTIAANTMAGDIVDPRDDRTTHIDQYSSNVIMEVTWQDYSVVAKLMAAGTSLHQGDLGLWNKWLNAALCLFFIVVSVTGVVMWWIRRPKQALSLAPPPSFTQPGIWKTGLVGLILICIAFPMAGLSIAFVLALDYLVFSKLGARSLQTNS